MIEQMGLLEPKRVVIDGKEFYLSKYPAIAGREIVSQFLPSAMPKVGDYKMNEGLMRKSISYVVVNVGNTGRFMRLDNDDLINSHTGNYETLLKLEWAMMEYNCSFFQNGQISTFLENIIQTARTWITKTLTDSLAQSLQKNEQPSTN